MRDKDTLAYVKAMEYSKKQEDFLKQRSRDNLVEVYREELLKVIEGYNHMDFMPFHVRRRMREEGIIIKKVGSKYTVTELGRDMLKSSSGGEG